MTLKPDNIGVALVCRPNGILGEIIYDELGVQHRLTPGQEFSRIVAPFHIRKVTRFLRTIQVNRSALDWELTLTLPHGLLPFFFSGSVTTRGIIIIGTKEPLGGGATPIRLSQLAEKSSEAIMSAINELRARTKEKAKIEEKLQQLLFELNQALTVEPQDGKQVRVERVLGSRQVRLLEVAAHDLRNPVSSILAATQYLIEDTGHRLETYHVTLLRSIESSAGLMLQLLRDMLEIPTINPRRISLDLRPTDIGVLVENAVAANRPLADTANVSVELRLQKPLPSLTADPLKLTHALEGLLNNAIRLCHAGNRLELLVAEHAGQVLVKLRHDGGGKAVDVLGSLFDHAETNRPSRRLLDERASLAITYLKRVLEAHHGTLQFEADQKQESAIVLTLPVSQEGKSPAREERQGRKTRKASE